MNDVIINDNLLQQAIDRWGVHAQVDMAFEECGELISALAQWRRGRPSNVVEEIADALIVVYQLRRIWGKEEVDAIVTAKMERLERRLTQFTDPARSPFKQAAGLLCTNQKESE